MIQRLKELHILAALESDFDPFDGAEPDNEQHPEITVSDSARLDMLHRGEMYQ